jgi:hypothetical protein
VSRSRRSVLAALAGGLVVMSGCGATDRSGTDTSTRSGTPTAAFTAVADKSPAPTESEAETETRTGTDTQALDEVTRAIRTSRKELATALDRLQAAEVVVDGRVGIVTENAFAEYARAKPPRPPIRTARDRLDGVSDRATGQEQRAVNGLLFLSQYLLTRAGEHDDIVDGFSSFYQADRALPGALKLEVARSAVGNMRGLAEHVTTAREALDRVEPWADALGVAGFDLAAAREQQATFEAIAREFRPAFSGALSTMRALGLVSATRPAIERGRFEQADGFASTAVTATENARSRLDTALEHDVRHYEAVFERDRCVAGGLATAAARYGESARAFAAENPERGRERYRAAQDALDATESECGVEL